MRLNDCLHAGNAWAFFFCELHIRRDSLIREMHNQFARASMRAYVTALDLTTTTTTWEHVKQCIKVDMGLDAAIYWGLAIYAGLCVVFIVHAWGILVPSGLALTYSIRTQWGDNTTHFQHPILECDNIYYTDYLLLSWLFAWMKSTLEPKCNVYVYDYDVL